MKTFQALSLIATAALLLTSCSAQEPMGTQSSRSEEPTAIPSSPITSSAIPSSSSSPSTSTLPTASSSASPTSFSSPSSLPSSTDLATSPASDNPAPLSERSNGSPLSLDDFNRYSEGWKDGTYAIANESGITGIGTVLKTCASAPTSPDMTSSTFNPDFASLRLNLGQKFEKLTFKAGQDIDSDVMNRTISFRFTDGKQQIGEIHTVEYDEISPITVDVTDQSVLFIQVYMSSKDGEDCSDQKVTPVLYDIHTD